MSTVLTWVEHGFALIGALALAAFAAVWMFSLVLYREFDRDR